MASACCRWRAFILPPEIGNLTNLTDLDLSLNPLTALPPEFGNLRSLQRLSLSVRELPPEFGNLTNLVSVRINSTTKIPPEAEELIRRTKRDW